MAKAGFDQIECPEDSCDYVAPCEKSFKSHYGKVHGGDRPYSRTSDYPPEWQRQRKRALERDGYRCQNCGVLSEKEGGNGVIHVHHVDEDKTNCSLDNLETLCRSCHFGKH